MSCKNGQPWKDAILEGINSLHKNDTWDLVELPKGRRVVGSKWIFKIKEGIPGIENARFKARFVAKGFTQKERIDFNEATHLW